MEDRRPIDLRFPDSRAYRPDDLNEGHRVPGPKRLKKYQVPRPTDRILSCPAPENKYHSPGVGKHKFLIIFYSE
jgi:hypothetical protein